jgi:glutamate formiminotransferase/formiminotetrahydrofolate cyclodeaminase
MSADKDYLSLPMCDFLADLAAKLPTPGGGSVAALSGAMAASQARMVIEYTVGKKRHTEHEDRLRGILDELRRAGDMFVQLMSEDMAAYERMAAAGKSKDIEERTRAVATVVAVPMEIIALADAVAARLDQLKSLVNPNLLCDLQVAAILSYAAARSASTSALININSMSDRAEADRLDQQLELLVARTAHHRDAVVHYQPE